jgi:hypothetical protein
MAKFYVQSGNLQKIIDSPSAERAAIWAVHQAMQQIAPQFSEEPSINTAPESIIVLGEEICISEVGFRSEPTFSFDTFGTFRKWYALCELVDLQ